MITASLQRDTLAAIHEGHPAKDSMTTQLAQSVWLPGMTRDIKEYAASCLACSSSKSWNYQPSTEERKTPLGPCVSYSANFKVSIAGKYYSHILIENNSDGSSKEDQF